MSSGNQDAPDAHSLAVTGVYDTVISAVVSVQVGADAPPASYPRRMEDREVLVRDQASLLRRTGSS